MRTVAFGHHQPFTRLGKIQPDTGRWIRQSTWLALAELDVFQGGPLKPFSQSDSYTLTAGELWAHREVMEAAAASLLGHMLFEFSRIDVNLGLCLVWVDNGANLESLTPKVAELSFHSKLRELAKHVQLKFPASSKRRVAYDRWVERMHMARAERNRLVHGRLGIEAHRNKVVNVVGLPTDGAQQVFEYSIDELAAVNEELRSLELELRRLRTNWPL